MGEHEQAGSREAGAANILMDQGRPDDKGPVEEAYTSLGSSEADQRDMPLSLRQALSGQGKVVSKHPAVDRCMDLAREALPEAFFSYALVMAYHQQASRGCNGSNERGAAVAARWKLLRQVGMIMPHLMYSA